MNCQRNLPSYGRWQQRYEKRGVRFVGIHTPETAGERKLENVKRRVRELKITYPVLIDPEGENWRRWGNRYWPTVYLIDKQGFVRYRWQGELEWQGAGGEVRMAALVDELLKEPL